MRRGKMMRNIEGEKGEERRRERGKRIEALRRGIDAALASCCGTQSWTNGNQRCVPRSRLSG